MAPMSPHKSSRQVCPMKQKTPILDLQSPPIFQMLPDASVYDQIRAYNQQATSAAFSFGPSPPLRIKTYPEYHRNLACLSPSGVSLTLPPEITVIRSTGKLQQVQNSSEFPFDEFQEKALKATQSNQIDGNNSSSDSPISVTPEFDCLAGPRNPPEPSEHSNLEPIEFTSGLFIDPFTEFMQDRLARFRPLDGQSNPNIPLDFAHPYQVTEDAPVTTLWTNWISQKWQAVSTGPARNVALSPIAEGSLQQNSSSLFLPREATMLVTNEPRSASIEVTPQAEIVDEAKLADNVEQQVQARPTMWCLWC